MYPHQSERLTAALERTKVEALVALSAANVAYLTGYRSAGVPTAPGDVAAVFARDGVALVVPARDIVAVAEADLAVDHVRCHGEAFIEIDEAAGEVGRRVEALTTKAAADGPAALAAALDALGVARGRIGLDEAMLPAPARQRLVGALGAARVIGTSDAFAEARMVKAPWEIECVQRALAIAEEAIASVLEMLGAGTTEREAAAVLEREIARAGATPWRVLVAIGAGAASASPWPTSRAARRGDLVRFDVGAVWRGYYGHVARMAVLGEPDRRQQALYDAVDAGIDAAVATIAPAVESRRVFDAVIEAARARGLGSFRAERVGHGIGLEPVEIPHLVPDGPPLEAGMIVAVEAPYYEVGWGAITVKETVLITRSHAAPLNRSRRGLVVLEL